MFCSKTINSSSLGRAGTGGFQEMTVQGPRPLSTLNSILQSCRQRYVICRPLFFLPFGWQTKSSLGDGAGGNVLPSVGPELGGSRGSRTLCPNLIVFPQQHSTKWGGWWHRRGSHRVALLKSLHKDTSSCHQPPGLLPFSLGITMLNQFSLKLRPNAPCCIKQ